MLVTRSLTKHLYPQVQINHMKRPDHDGYKLKDLLVITTAQGKAERDRRERAAALHRKAPPRPVQADAKEVQKEVNRFKLPADEKSKLKEPIGGRNGAATETAPAHNPTRGQIAPASPRPRRLRGRKPKPKEELEIGDQGQAGAVPQAPLADSRSPEPRSPEDSSAKKAEQTNVTQEQTHSPEESGRGKRKRKQTAKAVTAPPTPSASKRSRKEK